MARVVAGDPADAQAIAQAVSSRLVGAGSITTVSDEHIDGLPFVSEMMQSIMRVCGFLSEDLTNASSNAAFGCIPIYGDGSDTRLLTFDETGKLGGRPVIAAVIDLRHVLECLAHLCVSPLGRYSPAVDLAVAIEKLACATRIALMRDDGFAHLALGLTAAAQDVLHREDDGQRSVMLETLLERSFLTSEQIALVLNTVVYFQLFHEYGHHVCRNRPAVRDSLKENLDRYIEVQSTVVEHQIFHDGQNTKIAEEVLNDREIDLVLNAESSKTEYRRLIEAKILARQDTEELLCDDYAVQNTAKALVDGAGLGSGDWPLVRYTIETLLTSSWSVGSSRALFSSACGVWNRAAAGEADSAASESIEARTARLIAERKDLVLSQRLRLKYALERYDTAMASLLYSTLGPTIDLAATVDRVFPSPAIARVLHEFSTRHTVQMDLDFYSVGGLSSCSGRGRALSLLLDSASTNRGTASMDVFAYYVLGQGFHLDTGSRT